MEYPTVIRRFRLINPTINRTDIPEAISPDCGVRRASAAEYMALLNFDREVLSQRYIQIEYRREK